MFATANAGVGTTTITMFDDGISGQVVRIFLGDSSTIFDFTGSNLKGNGGSDWTAAAGDSLIAAFDGTDWYCGIDTAAAGGAALWRQEATGNFFGPASAGASLTTGDYNTAGGENALDANVDGSYHTAFGYGALGAFTGYSTSGITAMGAGAAESLTYGYFDVILGCGAANGATSTGAFGNNIAIGWHALNSMNGAQWNVAIGNQAGLDITDASTNVLIGKQAGFALTEGSYNTVVGFKPLSSTTDAEYNTAIGGDSMLYSFGHQNVAVGWSALQGGAAPNNLTGDNNVAVGLNAGEYAAGDSNRNIYVGENSGPSSVYTIENDKLYIGNSVSQIITGDMANDWITIAGRLGVNESADSINQVETNITAGAGTGTTHRTVSVTMDVDSLDTTSVVHGIGFDATGSTSGEVAAVSTTGSVDPIIQRSGTYATPSQTEYAARWPDGGAWTDGIDTHQVFSFDDDEIFIGSASTFSSIEVILTTPADSEVDPEFYYYDTSPAWVQFYPSDATNGFINDGVISWGSAVATHLLNWKSDYDPGGADGSAGYYIKVKRTQDTVVTPPTPTTIKTLDSTLYSWDESGDLAVNTVIVAGTLTVNGDQSGATDHVFDDYDDIELLRKWRNMQALPFAAGDMLNQDRLLRDAIIQLNLVIQQQRVQIEQLRQRIAKLEQ
jgi:hypothetical protein